MKKATFLILLIFQITLYSQSVSRITAYKHQNDPLPILKGDIGNKTTLCRFGANSSISSSCETLWDGSTLYTYLPAKQTLRIVCKSASDDTSGTGALTMIINGIDSAYAIQNETISLGGTDTVTTIKRFLRIWEMEIITAGSGGSNADTVLAYDNDGGSDLILAMILPDENITQMAVFTVPDGYNYYLIGLDTSQGSDKVSKITLASKIVGSVFVSRDIIKSYRNEVSKKYSVFYEFEGKTDIEIRVQTTGGSGSIAASFYGWYEPE